MPVSVRKIGKKFCVMEPGAKSPRKGRCFTSRKKAIAQTQAINLSLIRAGKIKTKRAIPPPRRKKK
jgi:hypothetical protein